jgi:membrane protein DedA with SNARE-associated domain
MLWSDLTTMLASAAGNPLLEATTIIIGTFILEDAATLLAAMQVASGAVSLPVALGALYAGIVLGDLGLYGLGRLSARHPWAQRLVPRHRRDIGQDWVTQRLIWVVLVSRFTPGLRLPTYTSCGFLRVPFWRFALAAMVATLAWTTLLFFVSLKLGALMLHYLGPYRWVGMAVLLVVLILAGRAAARWQSQRMRKDGE